MLVCPLCEHPQAGGDLCEVCGKKLSGHAAGTPAIPTLEGLEPVRFELALDVPIGQLPGLEPTHHAPVAAGLELVPDIERTRLEPVVVGSDPVPGLEHTHLEPIPEEDAPAPMPACRYCRTPAMPGEVLCSLCGMRLPVFQATAGDVAEGPPARCPSCGTPAAGEICAGCGSRIRWHT